jgi:phenylalanyl-tRNA synthetase beta chain
MKFSLRWLKDYVDITVPPKELSERLTMAGMEVKSIEALGGNWENMVVGEVLALDPHPNADRLKLAALDLGGRQVTVVCGAPNINVGQKVPFAPVGSQLIDGHTGEVVTLKRVKIRGFLSEGMVCSEKELGISENHDGIVVLPDEARPGMPLDEYLGDMIFNVDITPNRPDCLSMMGIAREIAALTGQTLNLPAVHYGETEAPIGSLISVDILEADLCPRYCASLIKGVSIGPSPDWLQQRLSSYGMRPINNVVDATNYVMLEHGQPLHAFDYDRLEGNQIVVRRARYGERIVTLDGVERPLNQDILVIADEGSAVAIAGIMGGLNAEVAEDTDAILVESANFDRAGIRRGVAQLQLRSEASLRFDKGLNPNLPLLPLQRATQLVLELAGGRAAKGIIDVYPGEAESKPIVLSAGEVRRLSGLEVGVEEMAGVLKTLGFACEATGSSSQVSVLVPYWRSDVNCAADLVEEVVRIIGYDKVPITRLSSPLPAQEPTPMLGFKQELRSILASCGFQEVLTYSLMSMGKLQKLSPELKLVAAPLRLANPMTVEQEYLRTTLRAGLLTALSHNQKTEEGGIRLFEIGKTFLAHGKELPSEKEMLCAVLSGSIAELSWHGDKEALDFFDAKGVLENLLNRLGLEATFEESGDDSLFPGRSASVIIARDEVGVVGDLHPKVAQAFELRGGVCLIEVDVAKLLNKAAGLKKYRPIHRFPPVTRDVALVVSEEIAYQKIEEIMQSSPLVRGLSLFDLYTGEQIPEGSKSFAIRVVYQSPDCTLTDEEVNQAQEQILDRLHRELGATLRG